MSGLSIRISKEMKEQMNKLNLDWPEYIRKMISQKIMEEKRREAARSMDAIRNKTRYGSFDAALSVREDRDS